MKSLALALFTFILFAAPASHAVPNGNAFGFWKHGPGIGRGADPAVPEPSGMLAFGVGLLTLYGAASRRRSK